MSPNVQAAFYLAALIAFLVAAATAVFPKTWWHFLVALGLGLWVFVPFWIAVKA